MNRSPKIYLWISIGLYCLSLFLPAFIMKEDPARNYLGFMALFCGFLCGNIFGMIAWSANIFLAVALKKPNLRMQLSLSAFLLAFFGMGVKELSMDVSGIKHSVYAGSGFLTWIFSLLSFTIYSFLDRKRHHKISDDPITSLSEVTRLNLFGPYCVYLYTLSISFWFVSESIHHEHNLLRYAVLYTPIILSLSGIIYQMRFANYLGDYRSLYHAGLWFIVLPVLGAPLTFGFSLMASPIFNLVGLLFCTYVAILSFYQNKKHKDY